MLIAIAEKGRYVRAHVGGNLRSIGFQLEGAQLHAAIHLPGAVHHHRHGAFHAQRLQSQHQVKLAGMVKAVEVKVLVTHDGARRVVHHHALVHAQVIRALPVYLLAIGWLHVGTIEREIGEMTGRRLRSRIITGDARGITATGIQAVDLKSLGGIFRFRYLHPSAGAFVDLHRNGSRHGLAGELVQSCLSMIYHIPLPVHLHDASMRVARRRGRGDRSSVDIRSPAAPIDDSSSISERA